MGKLSVVVNCLFAGQKSLFLRFSLYLEEVFDGVDSYITCSTLGCALEDNNILPGHFRDVLGDGSVGFFLEKMIVLLHKRH